MKIPFSAWEPDRATLDTGLLTIARNCYPSTVGFKPVPGLASAGTTALPADCVGMFAAITETGSWVLFAGTRTKLYKLVGSTWTDYTRAVGGNYNVPSSEYWSFAQFGSTVIACNFNDDPQSIDVDAGSQFAALAGSPPKARYVWVAGNFVFLGALNADQRAVRNSGFNDPTGWTLEVNLCSEEVFPDLGRVTGGGGGEYGYILQERGIRRSIFQPGQDVAFRFEKIEDAKGAAAGFSAVYIGGACFYLSEDGFYKISGQGIEPIGAQRVDEWFRTNSDTSRFFSVSGFLHPLKPVVMWSFFSSASSAVFDRVLVYDWQLDKWSYLDAEAAYWASLAAPGTTLDQLDATYPNIEAIPYSLDSRVFAGGRPVVAAVTSAGELAFLEGATPLTATFRTALGKLNPDGRVLVTAGYVMGEPNDTGYTVAAGTRGKPSEATSWRAGSAPSANTGVAPLRADGQLHQFEVVLTHTSGTPWAHVTGLDVQARATGRR